MTTDSAAVMISRTILASVVVAIMWLGIQIYAQYDGLMFGLYALLQLEIVLLTGVIGSVAKEVRTHTNLLWMLGTKAADDLDKEKINVDDA